MNEYFKMLHTVADTNKKDYTSIRELTIDIAKSGGYRRELVTLKNGKQVWRTKYNKPATWDNSLVAKWFCKFENLFMSKLSSHPELSEYYGDILQRTFTIYFNALQLDKLKSDSNVCTVVYMCLTNRIGEVFILKGSEERFKRYDSYSTSSSIRKSQDRVNLKSAVNHMMCTSLDGELSNDVRSKLVATEDERLSDVVLDITRRLKGNLLGERLLNAMLHSDKQVDPRKIRDYIKLKQSELNEDSVLQLTNAFKIIVGTLKEYYPNYDFEKVLRKKVNINNMSKRVHEMDI